MSCSLLSLVLHKTARPLIGAGLMAGMLGPVPLHAQTIQGVNPLSGTASPRLGTAALSADGGIAVGYNFDQTSGVNQAVRWSRAAGTQSLGAAPGVSGSSSAYGASADGSTVVGLISDDTNLRGFTWTPAAGMSALALDAGEQANIAYATNDDGSVIVGFTAGSSFGGEAFRWTQAGGKVRLGVPAGFHSTSAVAVSGDGAAVAGSALNEDTFVSRAFRWTAGGGLATLDLPAGYLSTAAKGISRDGSTVVGSASDANARSQAFRWTQAGGVQLLGTLSDGVGSLAKAVSGDGSVVVGENLGRTGTIYARRAVRWTAARGMESIESLLQSAGISLGGFRLLTATGVSADGTVITGIGNQAGAIKGWVARLPLNPAETRVFASVLPTARTTPYGTAVTGFATIVNAGAATAHGCHIELPPLTTPAAISTTLLYQTTDPSSNVPTGTPNTPADIAPGTFQTFYFAVTVSSADTSYDWTAQNMPLVFTCDNAAPASTIYGVTSFLVTASQTPIPDVLSIASTPSGDGILNLPGTTGANAMATAAINIGAPGTVICTANPNPAGFTSRTLAANLSICQTNGSGQCTNPATPGASVTLTLAQNDIATFSIFAQGQGQDVPFDPANRRVFFSCKQDVRVLGEASVAVRTQ